MGTHVIRLKGPWSLEFWPALSSTRPEELGSGVCDERGDGTIVDTDDLLKPLAPATPRSIRVPVDLQAVVPQNHVGRVVLWRNFNCPTGLDESTRVGLTFDDLPLMERLQEIRLGDEVLWCPAYANEEAIDPRHQSMLIVQVSALSQHNRLAVVWTWPPKLPDGAVKSDSQFGLCDSRVGMANGSAVSSLEFHGASLVIESLS